MSPGPVIETPRLAMRLGSRNLGPTRMPAPYQDAVVDIRGQSRHAWTVRREGRG
jgi:hypothetical protein